MCDAHYYLYPSPSLQFIPKLRESQVMVRGEETRVNMAIMSCHLPSLSALIPLLLSLLVLVLVLVVVVQV